MSTIPYLLPGKLRWQGLIAQKLPKLIRMGPRPVFCQIADNGLAPTALIWDMKTIYMSGTAQRLADTYELVARQRTNTLCAHRNWPIKPLLAGALPKK